MKMAYRADIDGLRAIAVLGVILFHLGGVIPGGYVGVDIFFVISGYLIISQILQGMEDGTFSLLEFWKRRILRIYPALLVMIFVTSVAGMIFLGPDELAAASKSVFSASLGLSNFMFARHSGYFDTASEEKPLLHTWSLGIEDQFYLAIPLLLLSCGNRKIRNSIMAFCFFSSFSLGAWYLEKYPSETFYLLPTRAWELLAGGFCYSLEKRQLNIGKVANNLLAGLGFSVLLFCYLLYGEKTAFPGCNAAVPVVGAFLVIYGGRLSGHRTIVNSVLGLTPLKNIGLLSYSLYLWHWPILAYLAYLGIKPISFFANLLYLSAVFLLATATCFFIEQAFRSHSIKEKGGTAVKMLGISFAFAGFGFLLWFFRGLPQRLNNDAYNYWAISNKSANVVIEKVGFIGCSASSFPNKVPFLGTQKNDADLILWGDSHGRSLVPSVESMAKDRGLKCLVVHRSGCAPVIGWGNGLTNQESIAYCDAAFRFIGKSQAKHVILVGFWFSYFDKDADFEEKVVATCAELIKNGKKIGFVRNVPLFPVNVQKELVIRTQWGLSKRVLDKPVQNSMELARENHLIKSLELLGVIIIDLAPALVSEKENGEIGVTSYDKEGAFYSDNNHLSFYGAMKVKPCLESFFDSCFGKSK